jgi:hypothetical protein
MMLGQQIGPQEYVETSFVPDFTAVPDGDQFQRQQYIQAEGRAMDAARTPADLNYVFRGAQAAVNGWPVLASIKTQYLTVLNSLYQRNLQRLQRTGGTTGGRPTVIIQRIGSSLPTWVPWVAVGAGSLLLLVLVARRRRRTR